MIADGNTGNAFRISSNGLIRATSSYLQRNSRFNLSIIAKGSSRDCNCARMSVRIHVLSDEVTFNPPQLRAVTLLEDSPVGYQVETVMTDGEAGQVRYSILSGNNGSKFTVVTVEHMIGQIIVDSELNYETQTVYDLVIRAESVANPSITGTIMLNIVILDVNEPPYFVRLCDTPPCMLNISESAATNSQVSIITARDPDDPRLDNGILDYEITPASSPFSINSAGIIHTTDTLDFEDIRSYDIEVSVSDRCSAIPSCSLTSTKQLVIDITDVNDNPPMISGNPIIDVQENIGLHSIVAQYSATDADSSVNAVIEFSIVESDGVPFEVDRQNGILRVIGQIDYEQRQNYTLTLRAGNPGTTLHSDINVSVRVINQNDERPEFSGDYFANVTEHSTVRTAVVTVMATDDDLDSYGQVRYSIISGNFKDSFSLDQETGEIRVAKDIDRESISSFSLVVEARDMGTPQPFQTTTTVFVRVIDINDNRPTFSQPSYSLSLREDTMRQTALLTVYASDADEPDNPNSIISYTINPNGNPLSLFLIDPLSGTITLNGSLDFETTPDYQLFVTATDQGLPVMSGTSTVAVTVENVNETPPSVSSNQTVFVPENAPLRLAIADFDAEDSDKTAVSFSLDQGNSSTFGIDSNGTVRLLMNIDYETKLEYIVEVIATDGERSVTAWLTVNVLDVNEYNPVFIGNTDFYIDEELPSRTTVGQVNAIDRDGSSLVTYTFAQQSQYFALNSTTGMITTIVELDREQLGHVFIPPLSQHTLTVIGHDQGTPQRQNLTTVTITLNDINDNAPIFANTFYEKSLLENLPEGQTMFELAASDFDLGSNGDIRFSFDLIDPRGFNNFFLFNEVSGLLETAQPLDCELHTFYNFTLTATDKGTPSRQATVIGVLYIIDENDNAPVFSNNTYTVSVSEDVETDSTVFTVQAEDPDKGMNGVIEFSLINVYELSTGTENLEDALPFFEINSISGSIVIKTGFDFEREQTVIITIIATDQGGPQDVNLYFSNIHYSQCR